MRGCIVKVGYFKSSFRDLVLDVSLFSTHSLRFSRASAAANAEIDEAWTMKVFFSQEWPC